jgi:hypothetical protein
MAASGARKKQPTRPRKDLKQLLAEQGPIPWGDNLTKGKRKPPVRFTAELKARFLDYYAKSGLFMEAAKAVNISYLTAKRHYDVDKEFSRLVDAAKEVFNESLEHEAHRRAVKGVNEPVFGTVSTLVDKADGKGKKVLKTTGKVGVKRKYSDTLLQFIMKKHMPEYRENMTINQNVRGVMITGQIPKATMEESTWSRESDHKRPDAIDLDHEDVDPPRRVKRG